MSDQSVELVSGRGLVAGVELERDGGIPTAKEEEKTSRRQLFSFHQIPTHLRSERGVQILGEVQVMLDEGVKGKRGRIKYQRGEHERETD